MDRAAQQISEVHFSSQGIDTIKRIFEEIPIPVILVDKNEKIIFLNKAYGSFLQVDAKDTIGRHILSVISNSNIPTILRTKKPLIGIRQTYLVGGKSKPTICHCVPIIENGESIACLGIILFHDQRNINFLVDQLSELQDEVKYYKRELKAAQQTRYAVDDIVGNSAAVKNMKNSLAQLSKTVGSTRPTLLITGESGSGKELVAQSFHNLSPRRSKPFVRLNCAAIPENLFESELFGYEDGAFTGAKKGGMPGKFEQANQGTLFLDEIGELPLVAQSKLLRVLQERELTRVGGNTVIPLDVCVIAATNRNLEEMVSAGEFRRDLFYRLDILRIYVPSLRERGPGDIHLLTETFLHDLANEYGIPKSIDPAVWEVLDAYSWPGNIRELRNITEKMYLSAEGAVIGLENVPHSISRNFHFSFPSQSKEKGYSLDDAVAEMEYEAVSQAMRRTGNNISKVAEILNISRPRIYRILKRQEANT